MDNLLAHNVAGVRETIEATGAMLRLLPPDSPDLNPIEQSFAKLMARLRKGGERSIPPSKPSLQKSATTTHACRLRVKLNGICSSYLMSGPRLKTEGRTRAERHLQLLDPDGDRPEAVCGPSGGEQECAER